MSLIDKVRKQKLLSFSLLIVTLAVGILIGSLVTGGVRAGKSSAAAPDAAQLTIPDPVQLSTAFTQLAKQLEPSVVNITSTTEVRSPQRRQPNRRRPDQDQDQDQDEEGMDFFWRWFGSPFPDLPERPFRSRGTGSGVIVDKNGYILTNLHVVEDASRIQVKVSNDPKRYDAKLIGSDFELDLAVIKIETGRALASAKIGNSDAVQVGDWAVAIGSPFGLEATVTAGIISAKGREIATDQQHQLQRFIQTDAAINPGNSGGPLLNIKGEVVGINTAIATASGGYQGVGFALPINMAANVYNQIIKTGKVSRGAIGIHFARDQNPDLLKAYGAGEGVFVQDIEPGGPADKAGVKPGDIVIAFNGKPVKNGEELVSRVSATNPGAQANVTVLREGKRMELPITVGERADLFPGSRGRPTPTETSRSEGTESKFGMSIREFRPGERDRLGFEGKGGVLITNVEPGAFAEDVGLARNDILVAINRQPVNSVDDVHRIQATLKPGAAVAFQVMRNTVPPGARSRQPGTWRSFFLAGTMPNP